MAVFRVEKSRDFTVMSNHHLRNKELSLKAKGLLSLMLSLPEDWDYTTKGLSCICKDGVDSICGGIKELEESGYVTRRRIRNDKGQLTITEYTIREQPKRENPVLDNPVLDLPEQAEPELGKRAQLSKQESNTQEKNTHLSNTHSFFPSWPPANERRTDIREMREDIREQIEYDIIVNQVNRAQVDEFVEIMLEVACSRAPTTKIGRDAEYPTELVQERFRAIRAEHIEQILSAMRENTTRVWSTKAYLLTALFNEPATLDNNMTMLVNHDMYGSGSR